MIRFANRSSLILATLCLALAGVAQAADVPLQGHTLRLYALDQPGVDWITQRDVDAIERVDAAAGSPTFRLHMKPDAAKHLGETSGANVGKRVRFVWDGKTVSDLTVQGTFGKVVSVPAPAS